MEKYGFIYIWFDSYRKMYYIGSHWGTEDDGYICSSKRMREAYRRRPNDFKRRIIKRIFSSRKELLLEENKILIKLETRKHRYYNLRFKAYDEHWITKNDGLSVKEKISKTKRDFFLSEEGVALKKKMSKTNKSKGITPPSRKGKSSWNKGLTKSTDSRVLALSVTVSKPKANTVLMGRYNKYRDELKGT